MRRSGSPKEGSICPAFVWHFGCCTRFRLNTSSATVNRTACVLVNAKVRPRIVFAARFAREFERACSHSRTGRILVRGRPRPCKNYLEAYGSYGK